MDNDQKKTPLNSYFEDAILKADADGFNLQAFITGLDAYGILPEEVSPIIADLHVVKTNQERVNLLRDLYAGVQKIPGGPENTALTQFSSSVEVQSALPVAPISEGRQNAHEDIGEFVRYQHAQKSDYLKGNIEWRRKVAQDFVTRLRKERLYGGGTDSDINTKAAIEKTLESPIYAKTKEEAAQKLAEKIVEGFSYNELFEKNREAARKLIAEAAKERSTEYDRVSVAEEIVDIPTTYAVEAFSQNPTLEDVHEVINRFASAPQKIDGSSAKELESAAQTARIYASVATKGDGRITVDPATAKEFASSIHAIQHNETHKRKLLEKVAVDDFGRELVKNGQADEFISRSEKYSSKNLKNKVTEYVAPAYTPNDDVFTYVAAEFRHNPSGVATPEGFMKATSHPSHFEFHIPDFSWSLSAGAKKPGMTLASAGVTIKKGISERARELGIKAMLSLGVKAGSKLLVAAPVIGWVILIGSAFSGTFKKVATSVASNVSNGGLGSIRAANGAISEFIQNALGTKYEDPLAPNGWLLALGLAVLPFLLAFLFTTMSIQVQRSSFLPIGVEGGLPGDFAQQFVNVSITDAPVPGPGDVPSSINYTVTISSIDGNPITINGITVTFSVFGGTGTTPSPISITGSQITGGTYTFSIPVGTNYNNSLITALVTANVDTVSQSGVDGSSSVSTIIGTPPTGCFVFGGAGQADAYGHTSSAWDDQSKVIAAIQKLAASPEYLSKYVCPGGPVTIYRVKADFGGGSTSGANMIFIYDTCVLGSQGCMTYTLAHESGHIVNNRSTSTLGSFHNQGISNREGFMWTYPNCLTESEDYAETIGNFVVWKYANYLDRKRSADCGGSHSGGTLNYPGEYPLHYQFAKEMFKMEY